MPSHKQKFNTAQPLKVFLCHSSKDKLVIRKLYQQLRIEGIEPWLDEEDLLPGQYWREEIPKAVRAADVVLVCLSLNSLDQAGYVQKEIKLALDVADEQPEGTIFVIPVRLEECPIPNRLQELHWVNLFEEKGYERLISALQHRADQQSRARTATSSKVGVRKSTPVQLHSKNKEQTWRKPNTADISRRDQNRPTTNRVTRVLLEAVVVLLLFCIVAGIVATLIGRFIGHTLEQTLVESPEEVAQGDQSILNYTLPAGYEEQGAFNLLDNTIVRIGPADQQSGMVIMLAKFSSGLVGNEAEMREQLETSFAQQGQSAGIEFAEVSTQDITINGEPTVLRTAEGTDENGNQIRQATAAFSTGDSLGMLMIMGDANNWDAAAVEAFLDSIR